MTNDYPPPSDITVGRAYPATGCVPHVPSPAFSVQLSPQRMYTQAELDAAIAADRAKREEAREGWQLVPKAPTLEMLEAAHDGFGNKLGVLCYRAMLAAAPMEPT
jgi:hypothetical protein